jgi:hypothetical protein
MNKKKTVVACKKKEGGWASGGERVQNRTRQRRNEEGEVSTAMAGTTK